MGKMLSSKKIYIYTMLTLAVAFCLFISSLEAATSNLELKGTLFTRPVTTNIDNKENSCNGARSLKPIAIIKDKTTGAVNMYEVGESIGQMKLLEVKRGEVLLQEGKAKYVLALPGGSVRQPEVIDFDIAKKGETFYISRAEVDRAVTKAPQLLREIKIMPHFSRGRPQGVRLSKIKKDSIFQKAGVKSDDVVKSVNGMTLNTPFQIFQAYKKLKDKKEFEVEVLRNNKPIILNYLIE